MAELHRRRGGRPAHTHRLASGLALAMSLTLLATAPAAAVDWFTQTLRNHAGTTLQDGDVNGQRAAVVWRESGNIWIRTQASADTGFGARQLLSTDARQAEVEACGSSYRAAFSRKYGTFWLVDLMQGALGGAAAGGAPVSPAGRQTRDPDVACTSNRVLVSWLAKQDDGWHVTIADALNSDMVFSVDTNVFGPVDPFDGQPVVAGAGNYAYLAYPRAVGAAHRIVVRGYTYAGGPGYDRIAMHTRTVTTNGENPQIAALGNKVVVVWSDSCGALKGRVSTNRGDTWGPVRTVAPQACAADQPSLLAEQVVVRPGDNAILVGYVKFIGGLKTAPQADHRLVVSFDNLATRGNSRLLFQNGYGLFKVAVYGAGFDLIAGVSDVGSKIQFRVQGEPL